jgi:hypothetical protein
VFTRNNMMIDEQRANKKKIHPPCTAAKFHRMLLVVCKGGTQRAMQPGAVN